MTAVIKTQRCSCKEEPGGVCDHVNHQSRCCKNSEHFASTIEVKHMASCVQQDVLLLASPSIIPF